MSIKRRILKGKTANLLVTPATLKNASYDESTGTLTSTSVDTIALRLRMYNGSATPITLPQSVGVHTYTFTASGVNIEVRHNGSEVNIGAVWNGLLTSGEQYTLSYNVVSDDTLTVGGFVLSNIMLVEGTTVPSSYVSHIVSRILRESTNGFRLVQDYKDCGKVDLGTLGWAALINGTNFQTLRCSTNSPSDIKYHCDGYLNGFTNVQADPNAAYQIGVTNSEAIKFLKITFPSGTFSTIAEAKAWLSGHWYFYQRTNDTEFGVKATTELKQINRILTEVTT